MPQLPPIVDPAWVHDHLGEVVPADVRPAPGDERPGWRAYLAGHLPGAVFVDLDRDLSGDPGPVVGRHPLPSPERFAEVMSRLGIADDDTVVAYDDTGGSNAARLVWMLRVTGHEAALLDGGVHAWPGELSTAATVRGTASFTARPWPADRVADADEVDRALAGGAVVVDARDAERFRGESEPIDAVAGRIPGAVNAPYRDNLDERGRFRLRGHLRERYEQLVGDDADEVIVYCGSGVTACHDLLAMELVGREDTKLYVGSWSGWSTTEGRPVETG